MPNENFSARTIIRCSCVSCFICMHWTVCSCTISWSVIMWGLDIAVVRVVRPSVHLSYANISKLSKIDVSLLGNANRNPGFPIQNLPSDSRSEVWFRHFGCFPVAFSNKLYREDGTTPGTVAGQQLSCPIMDDTLFVFGSVVDRLCRSLSYLSGSDDSVRTAGQFSSYFLLLLLLVTALMLLFTLVNGMALQPASAEFCCAIRFVLCC